MDKPKNRIKEVLEEKGIKRQPSLDVLFEIANILHVDPKDLIISK